MSEQSTIYKDYRAAMKHLKSGREFADWLVIARGYEQARNEAMRRAGTNVPHGATYNEKFAEIDRREKLIDRDVSGHEFPSREDRTFCIRVLRNYEMPSEDPRRKSIKDWRDSLPDDERIKLNHPKRVWQAYWRATEPHIEREAKAKAKSLHEKPNPHLEAIGNAEAETHAVRREVETLRELIAMIRNHVNLPDDIISKIDAAFKSRDV